MRNTDFIKMSVGSLICAFILNGCLSDTRRALVFLIPQGYVGWIRLKSNVTGAKPLPVENGSYVVRIPANGLLKTSTPEEEGWGADRFYYFTPKGDKVPLPTAEAGDKSLVWGSAGRTNESYMFIGTKQQFSDAQRLIGGAEPGPLTLPITSQSEQKSTGNAVPSPLKPPPGAQSKQKKP